MNHALLGIEIGGTKLQMVVGDQAGLIAHRQRITVKKHRGAEGIRAEIDSALPLLLNDWKPVAIGVGFGGPVDWRTGRIARSHQIEGWSDFDLRGWLRSSTGLPVWVENDANTAALAEATRGAGAGFDPLFYVTLGSGVGGGLVVAGEVYHGAAPGEAEIGHVRLDRAGTIVEARCSGWAVDERIRHLAQMHRESVLARLCTESPGSEARHLPSALEANDPHARRVLRETAEDLAFALSHVTHLFHPAAIVLGGGLSLIGEPLRAAVAEALPWFVMEVFRASLNVRLAALGEDAVPVGALLGAGSLWSTKTEPPPKGID